MTRLVRSLCLLLLLGALPACAEDDPPLRVLLVGDSVTQGSAGDWTWRYRLWQHLEDSGVEVDLVGPSEQVAGPPPQEPSLAYADPDFDRDHAGRWGKSFVDTDWPIDELVEAYEPDVVVELLGINDAVWRGTPADQLVEDARRFVADAQAADPDVDVVLGELPQTWVPAVPEYDAALAGLATELTTDDSEVVVARTADGFEQDVDTYDPLHPSATGEVKIAAGVADALAGLGIGDPYGEQPDVEPVPVQPAELAAVPAPGAADLTWDPPPGGWTAYVWRRNATLDEEWVRLPLGLSGTAWRAEGLVPGDTYEFRLQMAKGTSESRVLSEVVAVVPEPLVPGRVTDR